MGLSELQEGISNIGESVLGAISNPIVAGGVGVLGGAVVGSMVTAAVLGKSKTSKNRSSRSRSGRSRDRKFKSKQKWEQRYKRKKPYKVYKSKKRRGGKVKYTKKGQPYIILSSGKARFIKKRGGNK